MGNINNIIESFKTIQVGPGQFDKIGIHRIKRKDEDEGDQATVVMVPGSNSDFKTSFSKIAKILAQRNCDVFGIDFRYSFVPNDINSIPYCLGADCSFMKNWDTNTHISDLDVAVKAVELCSNSEKVFLMGYSQGAYFAYKYATQNPNLLGIIPLDIVYNLDPANTGIVPVVQADIFARRSKIAGGIYYEDVLTEKFIAGLALQNPNGPSPIIPNLTNKQAFLFALTATYQLPGFHFPNFRYTQGDVNQLVHTDYNFILTETFALNSFQSILPLTELREQWLASPPPIPIINVPILHVAAEFGFGTNGFYTPGQIKLFNPNVSELLIKDYGHADLVYSNTIEQDVLKDVCEWIKTHNK